MDFPHVRDTANALYGHEAQTKYEPLRSNNSCVPCVRYLMKYRVKSEKWRGSRSEQQMHFCQPTRGAGEPQHEVTPPPDEGTTLKRSTMEPDAAGTGSSSHRCSTRARHLQRSMMEPDAAREREPERAEEQLLRYSMRYSMISNRKSLL